MTEDIRHFQVDVPQEELDDLRRRVAAMRWPDRELVDDRSRGRRHDPGALRSLATHDWRSRARLQALPHSSRDDGGGILYPFRPIRWRPAGGRDPGWPGSII